MTRRRSTKRLVQELVGKVSNPQDVTCADRVFPPDWPTGPELPPGREGVKRFAVEEHWTFPDIRCTRGDLIAEGDRVAVRWSASGTQRGAVGPIPPTGGFVSWSGIHIFRIRDGMFADYSVAADSLGRLRQLGVELVPPPAEDSTSRR